MYYATSSTSYFHRCEIDGVWRFFLIGFYFFCLFFELLSHCLLFPTCLFVCLCKGVLCLAD